MKKLLISGMALALVAGTSFATVALDIAFDPAEVCPGDEVSFFFSLENTGDEAEVVDLAATISFGEFVVGPIVTQVELAAGEVVSKELGLFVPPPSPAGLLVIDAAATDSDGTVEDSATLEILDCGGDTTTARGLLARTAWMLKQLFARSARI